MNHEQSVKFRREYYMLLDKLELKPKDIEFCGDILELCRARILEKNKGVKLRWMGGDCRCDSVSTFDITLEVDSLNGEHESYTIPLKLRKANEIYPSSDDNVYLIPSFEEIEHSCDESAFNYIKRLPGPCHHKLAAKRITEKCLPLWTTKKFGKKKTFTNYVPIPDSLMNLYYKTEELPANQRRELLWNYARELRKGRAHKLSRNQTIL